MIVTKEIIKFLLKIMIVFEDVDAIYDNITPAMVDRSDFLVNRFVNVTLVHFDVPSDICLDGGLHVVFDGGLIQRLILPRDNLSLWKNSSHGSFEKKRKLLSLPGSTNCLSPEIFAKTSIRLFLLNQVMSSFDFEAKLIRHLVRSHPWSLDSENCVGCILISEFQSPWTKKWHNSIGMCLCDHFLTARQFVDS